MKAGHRERGLPNKQESAARLLERMRADWNERALEDAHYFVAFGRREQDEAEFLATAADVVRRFERELRRLPPEQRCAALEIGCGPGRLMRPLSRYFTEIRGVDVSDEMVRAAQERLGDVPNARVFLNDGCSLAGFAEESFDFVYSYAVFQHIPSRSIVFDYLREAWRVLRPGGYLHCQLNGLPQTVPSNLPARFDTWEGIKIPGSDVADFAREHAFQLLALEGELTQYLWVTLRKRGPQRPPGPPAVPRVRRVTNAYSSEPIVPARGRLACVSLWFEDLDDDCDLNDLRATIAGRPAKPYYVGPPEVDTLRQMNIQLPRHIETGLLPLEVLRRDERLAPTVWVRVVPGPPAVPRLISVCDAVELRSPRILSGMARVTVEEVLDPAKVRASVDDVSAGDLQFVCTDPLTARYDLIMRLPPGLSPGVHNLQLRVGARRLAPRLIEVQRGR